MAHASDALKEKIRAALSQLDHANDQHWTDDGLPRTQVVQELAAEGGIKRSDINEAAPGFMRKAGDAMGDPPETTADGKAATGTEPSAPVIAASEMSEDEANALLARNISAAEAELEDARAQIRDGQAREKRGIVALHAAQEAYTRMFPPMTQMDATKEYIASENLKRALAVGAGHVYGSQIDQALSIRSNRGRGSGGWARPQRFMGASQTRQLGGA